MKMIRHLIDYAYMIKSQRGYSNLRAIVPECLPSDESMQSSKEDEDETNMHSNWSMSRKNKKKRPGNKCISDEVANF